LELAGTHAALIAPGHADLPCRHCTCSGLQLAPLGSGDQSELGLLSGVKLTRCEHYWDSRCSSAYAHGIFNRQFEPRISQIVL
jgi:hypothetical protein